DVVVHARLEVVDADVDHAVPAAGHEFPGGVRGERVLHALADAVELARAAGARAARHVYRDRVAEEDDLRRTRPLQGDLRLAYAELGLRARAQGQGHGEGREGSSQSHGASEGGQ